MPSPHVPSSFERWHCRAPSHRLAPRHRLASSRLCWTLAASLFLLPCEAHATYSIVAVDTNTEEVGAAVASCVGNRSLNGVLAAVAGKGAIAAQALVASPPVPKEEAARLLAMDTPAQEILAVITDPDFDSDAERRQYAIVPLAEDPVAFTGSETGAYSGDVQGSVGVFRYSIQGNILTSEAVLLQARQGFEEPTCDLADALMRSLQAGAENEEGDSRCTDDGIPADSAYIGVMRPDGSWLVQLSVSGTQSRSSVDELHNEYMAWRSQNECEPVLPELDAGAADPPPEAGVPTIDPVPSAEPSSPVASASGSAPAPNPSALGSGGSAGAGGIAEPVTSPSGAEPNPPTPPDPATGGTGGTPPNAPGPVPPSGPVTPQPVTNPSPSSSAAAPETAEQRSGDTGLCSMPTKGSNGFGALGWWNALGVLWLWRRVRGPFTRRSRRAR